MSAHDPVNILLVDDQPAKLLSYEVILSSLGENLIKAGSAREAFGHLLKTDVAIVLVDVCMPELDGFQLVSMLREHPRFEKTAVIFISAIHQTELDLLRGYETGAVDFVQVPVVPEILRAKVRIFVELYRKTRQLEQLNSELERRVGERTAELEKSNRLLRESEGRRNLALAAGQMGSWDWEIETGAVSWDEAQYRIFGVAPSAEPLTLASIRRFVHPEDLERVMALAAEGGKEPTFQLEVRVMRPDGEVRWCICAGAVGADASGRVRRVSGVTIDITDRKHAEEQQQLLMAELDHRVKNILANVMAVAHLSSRQVDSVGAYVEALDGRIQAMSRAHGLLRESNWRGATLEDLVTVVLQPFRSPPGNNIEIRGVPLPVDPKIAQSLSLVLHELATNAVKHGALSVPGGRVVVDCAVAGSGSEYALSWRESGGPPVSEPKERGFGLTVLDLAASEIGARVESRFGRDGLECVMTGPFGRDRPLPRRRRKESPAAPSGAAEPGEAKRSLRVLIVEDEALIALHLQTDLENNGHCVVGPAYNLPEGLDLAQNDCIDVALLDVRLGGELSVPIADRLLARGIPLAFATGYSDTGLVPEHLRGIPRLNKPYRLDAVLRLLGQLVAQGTRPAGPEPVLASRPAERRAAG